MYREIPVEKWLGPSLVQKKYKNILTLDTGYRLIRACIYPIKPYLDSGGDLFLDSHSNWDSGVIHTADTVGGSFYIEDSFLISELVEEVTSNSPKENSTKLILKRPLTQMYRRYYRVLRIRTSYIM